MLAMTAAIVDYTFF